MPQRFPTNSIVKYPVVNGFPQAGLIRNYDVANNNYTIIRRDGTEATYNGDQLHEHARTEGELIPSVSEDDWASYLPDVPQRDQQVPDPGRVLDTNERYGPRQRTNQAMLKVERKAAKKIDTQIADLLESSDALPNHHLGCIKAGMGTAKQNRNPILRWIMFVMAYSSAFSKSFTDEFTLWVSRQDYWQTEIDRAPAGARKYKPPLLFIIISKCSADDYCANMNQGNAHPHRQTLDNIRTLIETMFPGHHIILIDIPATLFGCKRGMTKKGYKSCKTSSKAGLTVLKHIIKMLIAAALACGIQVLGISSISATIDQGWIDALLDGSEDDLGTGLPELLFGTEASYRITCLKWETTYDTIRGRGLHYVFMHMSDTQAIDGLTVGQICTRLTAWSLGVCNRAEQSIIGERDAYQIRKLAFMMHDVIGVRMSREWLTSKWAEKYDDDDDDDDENQTSVPQGYDYPQARQVLLNFDTVDIDVQNPPNDDDSDGDVDDSGNGDETESDDDESFQSDSKDDDDDSSVESDSSDDDDDSSVESDSSDDDDAKYPSGKRRRTL